MLENKTMIIANFNLTFGKDDEPMLNYFEDIIYPAFKNADGVKYDRNPYTFENVTLTMKNGIFVLCGLLVKSTVLQVKSRYDSEGKLQQTSFEYPSDPYSYFMINLQNHRMALVKNQKGSPTVKDLETVSEKLLTRYVKEVNKDKLNENDDKLPMPMLNIVSIPFSGKIVEELKKVKKIEKLTLRFYPLNLDISTSATFNHLREMLEETGSKTGNTQINTPTNHEGVGRLLEETKGLIKPSIQVVYKNNSKRTLTESNFSQTSSIELDDIGDFQENLNTISGKVINQQDYVITSDENGKLYERLFSRLEQMYNNFKS
ncbi:hypothetical protein [Paenibacillus macquariensis]|uniref:Uncharacterized protein n=1 Tax=Paenibacillus macquariensis TaxID=948756 RepID=A0ABY1KE51_9BACL|nr:hypothetical protein [Paenibacillus macquariensis]MEC0093431.1 hypothetical protein [Paenibacillus macquariensis]OAB38922.1 hypothetical protein PMSM_01155 [Paenibacillus macquariensis subsp. macquariensis]SIR69809.1 hypothetical protein SAMN05421578_1362 [Paenibacillus macquariensis]